MMKIEYHYELEFQLQNESKFSDWVNRILISESKSLGVLSFIFCDDVYLNKINVDYLDHDTFTDIITFNYCDLDTVSGDIFISIERVKENAVNFNVAFDNELKRVMSHGLLHLIGFNDKSDAEKKIMRLKENQKIELFHVEH